MSRIGCFTLGLATGALTVLAFRRLREVEAGEDVETLSDSIQDQLEKLESRIQSASAGKPKRTPKKPAGS